MLGQHNTITCTPAADACEEEAHFRNTGGACVPCDNIVCTGEGQYRTGVCSGKVNGYQCLTCANKACPEGSTRLGTCTGTANGWYCAAKETPPGEEVPNIRCGANQFRKGSGPGECFTCSNIVCDPGQTQEGQCGGSEDGWTCAGTPLPPPGQQGGDIGASSSTPFRPSAPAATSPPAGGATPASKSSTTMLRRGRVACLTPNARRRPHRHRHGRCG